jgi:hypothetical protein
MNKQELRKKCTFCNFWPHQPQWNSRHLVEKGESIIKYYCSFACKRYENCIAPKERKELMKNQQQNRSFKEILERDQALINWYKKQEKN